MANPKPQIEQLKPFWWPRGIRGATGKQIVKHFYAVSKSLADMLEMAAEGVPYIRDICLELNLNPKNTRIVDVIAAKMIALALDGNTQVLIELLNRAEGKVTDRIESNAPIVIEWGGGPARPESGPALLPAPEASAPPRE